jgi:hypothetical protein
VGRADPGDLGDAAVVVVEHGSRVGAEERERRELACLVPELLEPDGGVDVAVCPQQGNHLAEDARVSGAEQGGQPRVELLCDELAAGHQLLEHLRSIEGPVAGRVTQVTERHAELEELMLQGGAVLGRGDHGDGFARSEAVDEERSDSRDQLRVIRVEAERVVTRVKNEWLAPHRERRYA